MLFAVHRWLLRRPRLVVAIALLSLIPMGGWSAQLFGDLRADVRELLPQHARSVETLRELERRFGGWSQLSIVIESNDRAANRRFSDALVERLAAIPAIRTVRNKLGSERAFFEKRWQLCVALEDLQAIEQRIARAEDEARARANPLLVDLEQEREPVRLDFEDLDRKYSTKLALAQQFPEDYFEAADGRDLAVIVRQRGLAFTVEANRELVQKVEAAIAALHPPPGMVVGLGGDVMNLIVEHDSLVEDLALATAIVTALIMVVIVAYYRRFRALVLLGLPVLVATTWTFGISHFAIGYLNASTAFLGAIIPGNGINVGLILLARYFEERRGGHDIAPALDVAVRSSARATSTAAFAAAISYGSLIATDFLGFKHFGIIGGIGMVLSWTATFVLLPALIQVIEPRFAGDVPRPDASPRGPLGLLAGLVERAPRLVAVAGAASGLVAFAIGVRFMNAPFEKDFSRLRSTVALEGGAAAWEAKVDRIFQRYLSPQVILADRTEDVPAIVAALEAIIREGGENSPIADVSAVSTLVPDRQPEKIAVLSRIRALLSDRLLAALGERERKLALEYRPAEDLVPYVWADLPETVRADFRELDGREGHVILVLPNLKLNLYHADEIRRVADVLRRIQLPDGRVLESSGNFVIYSDMLASVETDGPRATRWSLLGVLILCVVVFRRPRRVLLVAASLGLGVVWLLGALSILGIKINFLNFIGLPITFGIGVDYAVNVYARHQLELDRGLSPRAAAIAAMGTTGGAVILCSLTTIIGYASLLVARNGALISFGRLAILGEITCLGAAILVLPAWLSLSSWAGAPRPAAP
jgi:predicted RND superfamily exporter protein